METFIKPLFIISDSDLIGIILSFLMDISRN